MTKVFGWIAVALSLTYKVATRPYTRASFSSLQTIPALTTPTPPSPHCITPSLHHSALRSVLCTVQFPQIYKLHTSKDTRGISVLSQVPITAHRITPHHHHTRPHHTTAHHRPSLSAVD